MSEIGKIGRIPKLRDGRRMENAPTEASNTFNKTGNDSKKEIVAMKQLNTPVPKDFHIALKKLVAGKETSMGRYFVMLYNKENGTDFKF